ncbi:hypothetical protein [Palleronia caenipelagi]|uniref:Uncharacterized protein n=1 Tax=Palleronia caenipelagi TaxID=2489174 RepID=A0A547PLG9_9RHOB|nr:hypothetical protein [Palleronia caenipelagi]TRD14999.1 hypothetical protein FEV53_17990 [Palleronia caenipelagi]
MQVTQSPQWQRQNLVVLERIRRDVNRFTNPLFEVGLLASIIYTVLFAKLKLFSVPGTIDPVLAALPVAAVVVLVLFPAVALAGILEFYLRLRISTASRDRKHQLEHVKDR